MKDAPRQCRLLDMALRQRYTVEEDDEAHDITPPMQTMTELARCASRLERPVPDELPSA